MMRSPQFIVTVITEVAFVSEPSDEGMKNYLKHLTEDLSRAANALSLRTVQEQRVLYCGGGVVTSGERPGQ